jgi:hypothetical protein
MMPPQTDFISETEIIKHKDALPNSHAKEVCQGQVRHGSQVSDTQAGISDDPMRLYFI